jgi:hypothetical protein
VPPTGFGDYNPLFVKSIDRLVWFRGTSVYDSNRDLWMSNINGIDAKRWIKNVETIEFYEGG